jgi:hypothetical protein
MFTIEGAAVFPRAQAEDPSCGSEVYETLDRAISESRRTAAKSSRTEIFNRRQLFTTERIAATFGPACPEIPVYVAV